MPLGLIFDQIRLSIKLWLITYKNALAKINAINHDPWPVRKFLKGFSYFRSSWSLKYHHNVFATIMLCLWIDQYYLWKASKLIDLFINWIKLVYCVIMNESFLFLNWKPISSAIPTFVSQLFWEHCIYF